MKIDVIIPTYKPDKKFIQLVEWLEKQTTAINKIIVINTEERYIRQLLTGTSFLSKHQILEISNISKHEYDHGKTRNFGAKKSDADILVYMTQDAIPYDEFLIENLVTALNREDAAVAYARQLPADDATLTEKITRGFNYPASGKVKTKNDLDKLGIKTFFCSNVCAAYKREVFDKLGGFINKTIFNEDMIFAATAIQAGYSIVYAPQARVVHSHNYTYSQQFKRNFDLGVSQAQHPEIFEGISSEKEGKAMVKLALQRLNETGHKKDVVTYVLMSGAKFLGYRAGKAYKRLPKKLVKKWSGSPTYWERENY